MAGYVSKQLDSDQALSALADGAAGRDRWQKLFLEDSGQPTMWLPVIMPRSLGSPIGIAAEGFWASPTANGLRVLSTEEHGVQLLVALEYPLGELRAVLSGVGEEIGGGSVLVSHFPFQLTIRAAIDTGSEEWIKRALNWLEEDRRLLDHRTKMLLKGVASNKAYDQKVRQRAAQLSHTLH